MKRNDVEKLLGITRRALIHYEKEGLIQPERNNNNYRNHSWKNKDIFRKKKVYVIFNNEEKSETYINFYMENEKMSFENIDIFYEDVYSIDVSICVSKV